MILTAIKTALVKALEDAFDADYLGVPKPRKIDIEYAKTAQDWPMILVQVHIQDARWTGINSEHFTLQNPLDPSLGWSSVRQGLFTGFADLEIFSTSSQERDRLWDALATLTLAGRDRSDTSDFYEFLENTEFVKIVVGEGVVRPQGDAIVPGTPWSGEEDEAFTYEASVRLVLTGNFFMNEFTKELLPLEAIEVIPTVEGEEPPLETIDDGRGTWQ